MTKMWKYMHLVYVFAPGTWLNAWYALPGNVNSDLVYHHNQSSKPPISSPPLSPPSHPPPRSQQSAAYLVHIADPSCSNDSCGVHVHPHPHVDTSMPYPLQKVKTAPPSRKAWHQYATCNGTSKWCRQNEVPMRQEGTSSVSASFG